MDSIVAIGDIEQQNEDSRSKIHSESLYKDCNSIVQPSPRRKSSVFSIINTERIIIPPKKSKPCLPIKCQLYTLYFFIFVSIAAIWLSLVPLIGYEIYTGYHNNNVINNASYPEKLLSLVNLSSNQSVVCPEMYIFVAKYGSCKPKCGEWSGCGKVVNLIERYLVISMDCIGMLVGILGIICWALNYREWTRKHFAIFMSIVTAILCSIWFAVLDFPGPKYLYCSNEEKEFDAVSMENRELIQVYTGILYFLACSFLFWFSFAIINVSLPAYFPLSARLQSKSFYWKLITFETLVSLITPLLIIALFLGIGGKYNLENVLQHPSYDQSMERFINLIPFFILYRVIITTFLLILYRVRSLTLKSQKYATEPVRISGLERRFITIGILLISVIFLRTFYSAWQGSNAKWDEQNIEYAACITLHSRINAPPHSNTSLNNNSNNNNNNNNSIRVADFLPTEMRDYLPPCIYPCMIPLKTIFIRSNWVIILSITSLQPLLKLASRILRILGIKPKTNKQALEVKNTTKLNLSRTNSINTII